MFRPALIPLLSLALICPAAAETLTQAVARAVGYFPDIQAATSRQAASRAQTEQARAEYFPSVNVTLGEGRENSRNISTRSVNGNDVALTRQEADLSVTQLLFDGGAAGGQVRRFAAREEGARFTVTDTAENAGARAGQTFVEVRRLREQLAVARENVATHEKTLSDVNALADAGRGRRADVTQADARRALAISAVEQLLGQLNQTEAAYRYFTGRLPADLDPPPDLTSKLPATLQQALRQAETHPAVRSAEKDFEAAQFDSDSARARYAVPRVTVEAGGSRNRDLDGILGPNRDAYAMLRLRYNLFRGFGDVARVRESEARIDEALAGLARARNEVERDVRQAWDTLAADRARLPVLAAYARASADVAEAYRLQFQLGQRGLLDVLNAENERFNATASFIAGGAAVTNDEIRLLASLGVLLASLGLEAPPGGVATDVVPQSVPQPAPGRSPVPPSPAGEASARAPLPPLLSPSVVPVVYPSISAPRPAGERLDLRMEREVRGATFETLQAQEQR